VRDHPDDPDGDGHTDTDPHPAAFSVAGSWGPWRLRHRRFERDVALS
jgi:hypothetical protein